MSKKDEVRTIQMKFRVTEFEQKFILKKAELSGCKSTSSYLRKMAITGTVIKFESDSIKDLKKRLTNVQSNINQIAKRANSTGNIYQDDIDEIKEKVGDLWLLLESIQSSLHCTKL
ncbi:MAG: plasmid mobilization relaxosome protein MobC [Ruminococcus sp.]|nr:plasmid mobilization relaxosome protein MobC [Ruminococcus sp.]